MKTVKCILITVMIIILLCGSSEQLSVPVNETKTPLADGESVTIIPEEMFSDSLDIGVSDKKDIEAEGMKYAYERCKETAIKTMHPEENKNGGGLEKASRAGGVHVAPEIASPNNSTPVPSSTPTPSPAPTPDLAGTHLPISLTPEEKSGFSKEMEQIVKKAMARYPVRNPLGLFVMDLKTGDEFSISRDLTYDDAEGGNTDGYFRAASVVKLQQAYVTYRLIEKGELDAEKTYYDSVTGKKFTLMPALHTMVSHSDNNLFNTFLRLVGREKTNEVLLEYGIKNSWVYGEISPSVGYSSSNNLKRHGTTKVGGKITPGDMGLILETIYNEKDTNPYMKHFNDALLANIYNSRIPAGINRKYPVAHKTGTASTFGVYNDAGIVYCKNPYILVVLTKGESKGTAEGLIRELAKGITKYMDSQ